MTMLLLLLLSLSSSSLPRLRWLLLLWLLLLLLLAVAPVVVVVAVVEQCSYCHAYLAGSPLLRLSTSPLSPSPHDDDNELQSRCTLVVSIAMCRTFVPCSK